MNKKDERKPTIDEVFAALDAARIAEFFRLDVDDLQSRLKGQGIRHKIISIDDASAAELFPRSTHSSAFEICVNVVLKRSKEENNASGSNL
jgi:hypothetical protein